jgi:YebC/PmpR family DNA-binding regulatory protein
MAGHSKWANIKHRKEKSDAARSRIFTRLIKELTVAARLGGSDIDSNARLRLVVNNARAENLPKDTMERAIKRGAGEMEGVSYEEMTYEGYGPGGIAVMVDIVTDNRNRTAADYRSIFNKHGGTMGQTNSVSFMFDRKGVVVFDGAKISEDKLTDLAIEAGADDVENDEGTLTVYCDPTAFNQVTTFFTQQGLSWQVAEIAQIPKAPTEVTGEAAVSLTKFLDALEDYDDTQKVYANAIIIDEE